MREPKTKPEKRVEATGTNRAASRRWRAVHAEEQHAKEQHRRERKLRKRKEAT